MGLLEIIEEKLKAEANQIHGKVEKRIAGAKGGMRQMKRKLNSKIADARLQKRHLL